MRLMENPAYLYRQEPSMSSNSNTGNRENQTHATQPRIEMDKNPAYSYLQMPQHRNNGRQPTQALTKGPRLAKPKKRFNPVWTVVAVIAVLALVVIAVVAIIVFRPLENKSEINSACSNESMRLEFQQLLSEKLINYSTFTTQLKKEIKELRQFITNITRIGSPSNPALNCSEIIEQDSTAISGTYWLHNGATISVRVTCDFDVQLPPPSPVRGWQEIANINMSDPTNSCPSPLKETTSPSRRCEKSSDSAGCESVFFATNRVPFFKMCGRVVGYSGNSPDAFDSTHGICDQIDCQSINSPYVDGISITYLHSNGREHVWSLTAEIEFMPESRCPCGAGSFSSPSFVRNDYYCEVAVNSNSPLWEGEGCGDVYPGDAPCCANPNFPWFCREFDQPIVTDNIEVRLCTDESRSNEGIQFDLLKLYIQ